jgi:hypothetical protein
MSTNCRPGRLPVDRVDHRALLFQLFHRNDLDGSGSIAVDSGVQFASRCPIQQRQEQIVNVIDVVVAGEARPVSDSSFPHLVEHHGGMVPHPP